MTVTAEEYDLGFNSGFKKIPIGLRSEITDRLIIALCVKSRYALWTYRTGKCKCSAAQAVRVEEVFAAYGITEIWGE